MNGLTRRQFECLAYLKGYITKHGYSPSFAEIGTGLGLSSKGNVHRLVHGLIDRGAIRVLPNSARSIAFTDSGWALASSLAPLPGTESAAGEVLTQPSSPAATACDQASGKVAA